MDGRGRREQHDDGDGDDDDDDDDDDGDENDDDGKEEQPFSVCKTRTQPDPLANIIMLGQTDGGGDIGEGDGKHILVICNDARF